MTHMPAYSSYIKEVVNLHLFICLFTHSIHQYHVIHINNSCISDYSDIMFNNIRRQRQHFT